MTPQLLLIAGLLAFAAGFGSGIVTHRKLDQADAFVAQQAAQAKARDDINRVEAAAASYVVAEEKAGARDRVVVKEVIRVVSKPVYLEQCLDDDGMHILADDAQASNTRRGVASAVPASAATD